MNYAIKKIKLQETMYNVTFDKNEIYFANKFIMRNEKLKKNVTICTDYYI